MPAQPVLGEPVADHRVEAGGGDVGHPGPGLGGGRVRAQAHVAIGVVQQRAERLEAVRLDPSPASNGTAIAVIVSS